MYVIGLHKSASLALNLIENSRWPRWGSLQLNFDIENYRVERIEQIIIFVSHISHLNVKALWEVSVPL